MTGLDLADDQLASCVGCGLCLPHCPTYRVTGEERHSPRGRIAVMRSIQWEGQPLDSDAVESLSTCIQCRGCEPACPSGVPYGRLIEGAKIAIESDTALRQNPWWLRPALRVLGHHRLLLVGSRLLAGAQRLGLFRRRWPRVPQRIVPALRSTSTDPDVWIFTGCVMDAWSRPTHGAAARLVTATGSTFGVSGGGCCGALHAHSGLVADARDLALAVMRSMPGTAPILVDSAGCGAALKDYGHLLGTDQAAAFSARVLDIHEWLVPRLSSLVPASSDDRPTVVVQEPCHLRHVQRVHGPMREVVAFVADIVDTDDEGLCCGAGGAFSMLQPDLAARVRDRKIAAIERARAGRRLTVVSANPGCALHLGAAGVEVVHPLELVADRIVRNEP
ncbi:MAG: (Fe-S)-binding protein [Actinomycetota bacterium]